MKTELFVPEKVEAQPLRLERLEEITGKKFSYSPRGRYAIMHMLRSVCKEGDVIMLPAYFCHSILEPVNRLKLKLLFYDLDYEDLNPSVKSIEQILQRRESKVSAILVPSFYGNPANLEKIASVCRRYDIMMIDDAAQSFGAKLEGKYVGTFGNAGLVAFSPGKATAGHMGSFFWTDFETNIQRKRHPLYHKVCYWNYKENRLQAYRKEKTWRKKIIKYTYQILDRLFYIGNDEMEEFESDLSGGYLWGNLDFINQRKQIYNEFVNKYDACELFRIIKNIRGESHPCKIVLHFNTKDACNKFKSHLREWGISIFGGYMPLPGSGESLFITHQIVDCVVELPIEINRSHMNYIKNAIDDYICTYMSK